MKTKIFVLFLLPILFLISCENSTEPEPMDSEKFIAGIIDLNNDLVSEEINKILSDLTPRHTSNDGYGHKNNFTTLIDRINTQCENVEAQLRCYACIETYPPQSEIEIITDSSGIQIRRVIDITTPADKRLFFNSVHK